MSGSSTHNPSEAAFGSFFVYSPRPVAGEGPAGANSRRLVLSLKKEARQAAVRWKLAAFVRDNLDDRIRDQFLGSETTLVPMPGHAPLRFKASSWPARELCEELVGVGLGGQWLPLLERVSRVNKAAFSPPDQRPTTSDHLASFRATPQLGVGESITVLDDVITRGATILAAVQTLRVAFPGARVRGFALVRTMSDQGLTSVVDPVEGIVRAVGNGTERRP